MEMPPFGRPGQIKIKAGFTNTEKKNKKFKHTKFPQ